METLINEVSKELSNQFSSSNQTSSTTKEYNVKREDCYKRIKETTEKTKEIENNTKKTSELIQSLKEKEIELQKSFEKIDELEFIINQVKQTYNQVAENLDKIEKAVSASTPFRLGQRKGNIPVQPYFPPPNHVDIFETDKLFKQDTL